MAATARHRSAKRSRALRRFRFVSAHFDGEVARGGQRRIGDSCCSGRNRDLPHRTR